MYLFWLRFKQKNGYRLSYKQFVTLWETGNYYIEVRYTTYSGYSKPQILKTESAKSKYVEHCYGLDDFKLISKI